MIAALNRSVPLAVPRLHPNDVDKKRIEKALQARKRYRYVTPRVEPAERGYRIVSPCCSRNVDPTGGVVDVARIEFVEASQYWFLYRKNHEEGLWMLHGEFSSLSRLLETLNEDPQRVFWQ